MSVDLPSGNKKHKNFRLLIKGLLAWCGTFDDFKHMPYGEITITCGDFDMLIDLPLIGMSLLIDVSHEY